MFGHARNTKIFEMLENEYYEFNLFLYGVHKNRRKR